MSNPVAPNNKASKDGDAAERPGFRSPSNKNSKAQSRKKKKKGKRK